ncbi:chaperone NapD [Vibrio profundum]|uniref:chaperone NapD n=1 Tax=Vibrio profundum TaxID=2910247 RepID=UPI003D0EB516
MKHQEVHISSLVVYLPPEHLTEVSRKVASFDNTEIYAQSPEGKLIIVLETKSQHQASDIISNIEALPNVLSTVLIYHQIDSEAECQEPDENMLTKKNGVIHENH